MITSILADTHNLPTMAYLEIAILAVFHQYSQIMQCRGDLKAITNNLYEGEIYYSASLTEQQ